MRSGGAVQAGVEVCRRRGFFGVCRKERPESVQRCAMIRVDGHKLVQRPGGVHELYHLVEDPRELENLYGRPEHAAVQQRLQDRLLDWYVHTADVVPWQEDSRGIPG